MRNVYVPRLASREVVGRVPGLAITAVEEPRQILPNVWTIRQMKAEPPAKG